MTKYAVYLLLIAFTAIAATGTGQAHAITYRWVDDKGIVNYSERKPRGIAESRLTKIGDEKRRPGSSQPAVATPAASTRTAAPASSDRQEPELSEQQKQMLADLEEKEAERQFQIAKIRDDNCGRARRVLEGLSARSRIRVEAEDGTQRVIPEEERQERISAAQRGIVENC